VQIVWDGSAVGSHSPQSEAKNGNYRRHYYCFKFAYELGIVRKKIDVVNCRGKKYLLKK
jgi:hypothetical protein